MKIYFMVNKHVPARSFHCTSLQFLYTYVIFTNYVNQLPDINLVPL